MDAAHVDEANATLVLDGMAATLAPLFGLLGALARRPGSLQGNCSGKGAVVYPIRTVDTSIRESDCALPKPVFATMEEVCYAHELRLQLRARMLRDAVRSAGTCSAGAD